MQVIERIGACVLPVGPLDDDVRGHWEVATCADYQRAIEAHGGLDALSVWSSFTNLGMSHLGEPFIFTCWGEKTPDGNPVAAAGGHPDKRWKSGVQPCLLDHAVFVVIKAHGPAPLPDNPEFDVDMCICGEEWPHESTESTEEER